MIQKQQFQDYYMLAGAALNNVPVEQVTSQLERLADEVVETVVKNALDQLSFRAFGMGSKLEKPWENSLPDLIDKSYITEIKNFYKNDELKSPKSQLFNPNLLKKYDFSFLHEGDPETLRDYVLQAARAAYGIIVIQSKDSSTMMQRYGYALIDLLAERLPQIVAKQFTGISQSDVSTWLDNAGVIPADPKKGYARAQVK